MTYLIGLIYDHASKNDEVQSYNYTKNMFDQHHAAYEKLVNYFEEQKIEAEIQYDQQANIINFKETGRAISDSVKMKGYEKAKEFLSYLKDHNLLVGKSYILFVYENPEDMKLTDFFKTKQTRYRVYFGLYYGVGKSIEILYESIDDRIGNHEHLATACRLRPNWFYFMRTWPQ